MRLNGRSGGRDRSRGRELVLRAAANHCCDEPAQRGVGIPAGRDSHRQRRGARIVVDHPVQGPREHHPAYALPPVTRTVKIDRQTRARLPAGRPLLTLDFNDKAGLRFALGSGWLPAAGPGLGSAHGDGITLHATKITINGDYIGLARTAVSRATAATASYAAPGSSWNVIGPIPGHTVGVVANVISGNGGNGIMLDGSSDNTVRPTASGRTAGSKSDRQRRRHPAHQTVEQQRDRRHRVHQQVHRPG